MYDMQAATVAFLSGDYTAAQEMFHNGAREGDRLASFNYGYCLLHGLGVERDPKEAKSFFAFARDMEGGESCYNLAMLYLHGEGVTKNFVKAIEYMHLSASLGCVEAQLYMGMAYTLGCAFEPDIIGICMVPYHKAEYRTQSPLLSGYVPDTEEEEDMRFSCIRADQHKAFSYFRAAARHKTDYVEELVAKGKYLYAKCYLDGLGTDFDRKKGENIMLLAGKAGSGEAIMYIRENMPHIIAEASAKGKLGK